MLWNLIFIDADVMKNIFLIIWKSKDLQYIYKIFQNLLKKKTISTTIQTSNK